MQEEQDNIEGEEQPSPEEEALEEETPQAPTKTYKCQYCGYETVDSLALARHIKYSHPKPSSGKKYTCKKCGFTASSPLELANHVRLAHGPEPTETPEKGAEEEGELTEEEIRTKIALEGRPALNKLKRKRLEEVLSRHPKVTAQAKDWILWKWDTDESLADDPQKLTWALMNAGLSDVIAYEITSIVWQLEQKYGPLLQQRPPYYFGPQPSYQEQTMPPPIKPPTTPPTPPLTPYWTTSQTYYMQPQQQYTTQPPPSQYTPPQYPYQSFETMELKNEINKLRELISARQQPQTQERMITIPEPLTDPEGKYIVDENGQIVTVPITIPLSTLPMYLSLKRSSARTREEEDYVSKLESAIKPYQERLEKLESELREKEKELDETKEKFYQTQINDLKETIKATQEQIIEMSKSMRSISVGEYKRDEFKLIADTLTQLKDVVSERKPVEKLVQLASTQAQAQKTPAEVAKQEQEAESLIEKELKTRGLIKE